MAKYSFSELVEVCGWTDGSQAGVLMEFIRENKLVSQLDEFVSERYGWEAEKEDEEE